MQRRPFFARFISESVPKQKSNGILAGAVLELKLDATQKKLVQRITELKKEKNAVILAHNYQPPELFEVADFMGDSYDLSVKASKTKADLIVFAGVKFMAETAKLLNPKKTVLLPALDAGCSMASQITSEQAREWRAQYPKAGAVCYINTYADVKAEFDCVCTSANAAKIVAAMPQKQILFAPDANLGSFMQEELARRGIEKEIILWPGFCYVHTSISAAQLKEAKRLHPQAETIVHPESKKEVRDLADFLLGTGGMIARVAESNAKEFIIGTETGMCDRLARDFPGKNFFPAPGAGTCTFMKKNSLQKTLDALEKRQFETAVPEAIAPKARAAIEKMLEIGK